MRCTRAKIVAQARSWLGRNEADGSHKPIIDIYNSHKPLARGYKLKYTDSWCAGFGSAVAIACEATDIIPTEVGVGKLIDLFKKMGIWVEDDSYVPKPGDYIVYDWKDDGKGENPDGASHVGIVEEVSGGVITVIEGNYENAVKRRQIQVNGKYIRGFGAPKYAEEADTYTQEDFLRELQQALGAPVTGKADLATLGMTVTVSDKINADHAAVKPLQKWLKALGYAEVGSADGKAGPKFKSAILHFQMDHGCAMTGQLQEWDKSWCRMVWQSIA